MAEIKYHETIKRDHPYRLSDGTVLQHYYGCVDGRPYYEARAAGRTRALNAQQFLAILNADAAKSLLPAFRRAKAPEEIIALSRLEKTNRGRTSSPEVIEVYATPDNRKYRVVYYAGDMIEWGFVKI